MATETRVHHCQFLQKRILQIHSAFFLIEVQLIIVTFFFKLGLPSDVADSTRSDAFHFNNICLFYIQGMKLYSSHEASVWYLSVSTVGVTPKLQLQYILQKQISQINKFGADSRQSVFRVNIHFYCLSYQNTTQRKWQICHQIHQIHLEPFCDHTFHQLMP